MIALQCRQVALVCNSHFPTRIHTWGHFACSATASLSGSYCTPMFKSRFPMLPHTCGHSACSASASLSGSYCAPMSMSSWVMLGESVSSSMADTRPEGEGGEVR